MKKLLNRPEQITYDRLREVCARHNAQVFAKVRLADVLPIEDSGLSQQLFEFALQAHYDFVIAGRDHVPLFAVEFDGPQHSDRPQMERDKKKDELSERFNITLLRVAAEDLHRTESRFDRLTELIEMWFGYRTKSAMAGERNANRIVCPLCGAKMVEKFGKYGRFLGCSTFPVCQGTRELPKPTGRGIVLGCRSALVAGSLGVAVLALVVVVFLGVQYILSQGTGLQPPIRLEGQPVAASSRSSMTLQERQQFASNLSPLGYPMCPICGNQMVIRQNSRTGDPFFGCSEFPSCRGTRDVEYPK